MTITAIYCVRLTVPAELTEVLSWGDYPESPYRSFHDAYEAAMIAASKGSARSGCDSYSDREEWAEFQWQHEAYEAEVKATAVLADFNRQAQALMDRRAAERAREDAALKKDPP